MVGCIFLGFVDGLLMSDFMKFVLLGCLSEGFIWKLWVVWLVVWVVGLVFVVFVEFE